MKKTGGVTATHNTTGLYMKFEFGVVIAHPLVYAIKQVKTIISTWIYCKKKGLDCTRWYGVFESGTENIIAQTGCLPGADKKADKITKVLNQ